MVAKRKSTLGTDRAHKTRRVVESDPDVEEDNLASVVSETDLDEPTRLNKPDAKSLDEVREETGLQHNEDPFTQDDALLPIASQIGSVSKTGVSIASSDKEDPPDLDGIPLAIQK
ncbi:hypothetical protein CALCODRAFT_510251 [Calocera cornea HHB12733]|uniref:Uncharacterized protein n=1 Tax=Calocera cornea HHB12733 TaxID=1353952 RepID=A0A165EN07_9BASI|nr:hypothetical protein CALCODRAFT_510251 [Calocera cornea HHB12733]